MDQMGHDNVRVHFTPEVEKNVVKKLMSALFYFDSNSVMFYSKHVTIAPGRPDF